MNASFLRNPIALAIGAVLLLILMASTLAVVPETKQAVIVRFGEIDRTINPYRRGVPFGQTGAGIIARWPFAEEIHWIDKRILSVDMAGQQVLSTDQLRLEVDAFARYRITDPLRMYISARTEQRVSDQLRPILGSALRNELGRRPFARPAQPERGQIMANIETALNRVAANMAPRLSMSGSTAPIFRKGEPLESVLHPDADRPAAGSPLDPRARRQAGADHPCRGGRRGGQHLCRGVRQGSGFYEFYRAMQSYEKTFLGDGSAGEKGRSSIILSPSNQYLKEFQGRP
jgi:membrane protease subunit HflC